MNKRRGFMLIELMVVIGIIVIFSVIGIPAYQNYLRKATLTDMLQTFAPYRMAVELCALEHGGANIYDAGMNGTPSPTTTHYVSAMSVEKGVISLSGQESLSGLSITMTPGRDSADGITDWNRNCVIQNDSALQQAYEDAFRFDTHQGAEMNITQLTTPRQRYQAILLDADNEVVHIVVVDAPSHEPPDALYLATTRRIGTIRWTRRQMESHMHIPQKMLPVVVTKSSASAADLLNQTFHSALT